MSNGATTSCRGNPIDGINNLETKIPSTSIIKTIDSHENYHHRKDLGVVGISLQFCLTHIENCTKLDLRLF